MNIIAEYLSAMRRMPFSAAEELHSTFGIPWRSITANQRGRILRRIEAIEAQQPAQVKAWLALPEYPAARPTPVFAMRAAA